MSEFFVIIYLSFQSLYGMFLKEGFYENGKIMLEDYIILCIENKKVRIIYDAGNTDLYLWKYGSFYLSRDWLSIIPNCPKENIVLIDRNKGILQCCNKKLLEKDYPFMVFRQKSSGVYKICEDRFISNTLRMLLNIFVKN